MVKLEKFMGNETIINGEMYYFDSKETQNGKTYYIYYP